VQHYAWPLNKTFHDFSRKVFLLHANEWPHSAMATQQLWQRFQGNILHMALIWHLAASSPVLNEHLGGCRFRTDGDVGIAVKRWTDEKDTLLPMENKKTRLTI
jgi:hypothetical protein